MTLDNHYKTIDELQQSTNNTIAGLLPGFIRRHREEIECRAGRRFAGSWRPSEAEGFLGGVKAVLDILAQGLVKDEPETPEKGCVCDGEAL